MPTHHQTRICFVRHGETDWNVEKRMQGHTDIPLNAHGVMQAERLAKVLLRTGYRFDRIYSSDLERAFHTAKVIASPLSLDITVHPDLRERHVGKLQGLLLADAPKMLPEQWRRHLARDLEFDLEGGESILGFHARMKRMLDHLLMRHAGEQILAVSHGGSLDMIYRIVTQQALDTERVAVVPNTSLNWIAHDGNTWSIERWGDTSHLTDSVLDNIEI
ncbi:histidine phosphatase family protein [Polynucleobacter acidiphobus]|uniref:histidine phosphatase family protein n=1 Tax=Polynucleobacter acidiphobus TaxID=556053 RepID=UPI000D3A7568|nr:histidine phosphatase family protein [Polynucleobacter acidiphobus]